MAELTEQLKRDLKEIVSTFDKEDRAIRERQIRTWRRLKLFWEGFQQTWYSEVAHDWRIWDNSAQETEDTAQSYYDKPVNIFRAYLESIIAALSITVPGVVCYPEDAENTLDLTTAKAGKKISDLVYRHNDGALLWLHALFIFCTEGMVAAYTYEKEDEAYGTYEKKTYDETSGTKQLVKCPDCGYEMGEQSPQEEELGDEITDQQKDRFAPDDTDVPVQAALLDRDVCPVCLKMVDPEIVNEPFVVTRLVNSETLPKSRVCIECYGGLYVKVPNYAKKQADCPYLIYSFETNYVNAIEKLDPEDKRKIREKIKGASGPKDPYEEWGRLNPQYQGEYPTNVVTVRYAWLRPCAFNVISDETQVKELKRRFPNGAKVTLVGDELVDACNESMDDCWTLTHNPLSDFIHFDALGMLLVSIQELTNDLLSLTVQTIEQGIPQTFADPTVLNFNAYRQLEATPGGIYEAKSRGGKPLGEGFYTAQAATLSPEVMPFAQNLQSLGQLVSGALPSLFGGAMEGQGETAAQYSMSRAQALQRLQNTWKMLLAWWEKIFGKAIPLYIESVQEDEKTVELDDSGNFVNIFIRKAELEGKIGRVEIEGNENLPITWAQKKDVIMQLLKAGIPEVLQIIGTPENLPVIREAIGLTDFFVPGEDDRDKQYDEIHQLLQGAPMQGPDGQEHPSVDIDPDIDDHDVEFEVCRNWLTSEAGRMTKIDNNAGYQNVLLHAKEHLMMIRQNQMAQQQQAPPNKPKGVGGANSPKPNGQAPMSGESDNAPATIQ